MRIVECSFIRNRNGTIAILFAILMPVMIGAMGLGAEVGYWYFSQRKVQNSADVAAHAGAVELRANQSLQVISASALSAATDSGFQAAIGTLTTRTPPQGGAFAGDANAVEVIVQENLPRLFTALFLDGDIPVSGRAVGRVIHTAPTCILALHPTAGGAVTFTGSSDTSLIACNVHANSLASTAVTVIGSGRVDTPCVSAVGNVSATSGLVMDKCRAPIEHADKIDDPYEGLAKPAVSGCAPKNVFDGPQHATYTIDAGTYCGGLTMKRTVTMNPGVYVVTGDFLIESTAKVKGDGVTIFVTGGTIRIAGTANVQLTAPDNGPYSGVLFFVDPDDAYATHIVNGDSSSYFSGAIYGPNAHIEFAGSSKVGGGCTQIVSSTITFTGSLAVGSDCTGKGLNEINDNQLVALVE